MVEVSGVMGQDVKIEAEFCSDPGPIRNTWNWDDIVLPSGNQYEGKCLERTKFGNFCKADIDKPFQGRTFKKYVRLFNTI